MHSRTNTHSMHAIQDHHICADDRIKFIKIASLSPQLLPLTSQLPLPRMIPAISTRPIDQTSRILDRHTIPHALLVHALPVPPANILAALDPVVAQQPQLLAGRPHRLVLSLQLELALLSLLP